MKKTFEMIGLISLVCFSFFITEKTSLVFENVDNIMLQIKENNTKYNIDSTDAIIDNNTIIPGIYGRIVDIKKSYKKMKKKGFYNEKLYIYKDIKPNISLKDNLDKYIINGNQKKRNISLIFLVGNSNIESILNILDKNNVKGNFFIDDNWFNDNNELVVNLIKQGYNIGNLSHELDYSNNSFVWMDTIIKNIYNQKHGYCYYTNNKKNIDYCKKYNNYTIKPKEINNNYLKEVKNILNNGVMMSFEIDNRIIKQLNSIINYIKNSGYNIVTLEELLNENQKI